MLTGCQKKAEEFAYRRKLQMDELSCLQVCHNLQFLKKMKGFDEVYKGLDNFIAL